MTQSLSCRAQQASEARQQAGDGGPQPLLRLPLAKRDANGDLKYSAGASKPRPLPLCSSSHTHRRHRRQHAWLSDEECKEPVK